MYVYDHIHTYGLQVRGAGGAWQRVLVAAQVPGSWVCGAAVGGQLCAPVFFVGASARAHGPPADGAPLVGHGVLAT